MFVGEKKHFQIISKRGKRTMKKTINEIENQINTGAGFLTVAEVKDYFRCHKQ